MLLLLFLLIIDWPFLMPAVIAQNFNPTAELVIHIRLPTKEGKPEIETYSVTAKMKIRECWKYFKVLHVFLCYLLIGSLCFISSKR